MRIKNLPLIFGALITLGLTFCRIAVGDPTLEEIYRVLALRKLQQQLQIPLSPEEVAKAHEVELWLKNHPSWTPARGELDSLAREVFWQNPRAQKAASLVALGSNLTTIANINLAEFRQAQQASIAIHGDGGVGSGVRVGPGLFLTNQHVITGHSAEVTVLSPLGARAVGVPEVLFTDRLLDIALFRIPIPSSHLFADKSPIRFSFDPVPVGARLVAFSWLPTQAKSGVEANAWITFGDTVAREQGFYSSRLFGVMGASGSPVFSLGPDGSLTCRGLLYAAPPTPEAMDPLGPMSPEQLGQRMQRAFAEFTGLENLRSIHGLTDTALTSGQGLPDSGTTTTRTFEAWLALVRSSYGRGEQHLPYFTGMSGFLARAEPLERFELLQILAGETHPKGWERALTDLAFTDREWVQPNGQQLGALFELSGETLISLLNRRRERGRFEVVVDRSGKRTVSVVPETTDPGTSIATRRCEAALTAR